jgi:hypothetical protein
LQLGLKYDEKTFGEISKFAKNFPGRMKKFIGFINYDLMEQFLLEIMSIVNEKEYEYYVESLEVVKVKDTDAYALVSNEMKLEYDLLSTDVDIVYFNAEKSKDEYSNFLEKNSPFVAGFVKLIIPGTEVIMRRVAKFEREKVLDKNLEVRDKLVEYQDKVRDKLIKIVDVYVDVYFIAMRLEFGLPGYELKPHWKVAKNKMDVYVKNSVKDGMLFDKKKVPEVGKSREIKQQEAELLKNFIKEL